MDAGTSVVLETGSRMPIPRPRQKTKGIELDFVELGRSALASALAWPVLGRTDKGCHAGMEVVSVHCRYTRKNQLASIDVNRHQLSQIASTSFSLGFKTYRQTSSPSPSPQSVLHLRPHAKHDGS
jgi:hypothetical protein